MWSRQLLKPGFVISGVCFVATIAFAALTLSTTPTWAKLLEAEGYPLTLEALDTFDEVVPDAENAAFLYSQARDLMAPSDPEQQRQLPYVGHGKLPAIGVPPSTEMLGHMQAYLEKNEEALALIDRAAEYPRCRYPMASANHTKYMYFRLEVLYRLSQLLSLQSIFHVFQGDMEQAVHAIEAHHALQHSLDSTASSCFWTMMKLLLKDNKNDSVRELLCRSQLSDAALARLQALYESEDAWLDNHRRALMGDAALFMDGAVDYVRRKGGVEPSHRQLWNRMSGREHFKKLVMTHRLRENCERSQRLSKDLLSIRPADKYLGLSLFDFVYLELEFGWESLSGIMGRKMMKDSLIRTAIALERYRIAHGALPETLEALTPTYLEAPPYDYYNDQVMQYKRTENGYRVYSLGQNGKDDGGVEKGKAGKDDMVLLIERAA